MLQFLILNQSEAVNRYYNNEVKGYITNYCSSCHGAGQLTCASTSTGDCATCLTGSGSLMPNFTDYNTAYCFRSAINSQVAMGISTLSISGMPPLAYDAAGNPVSMTATKLTQLQYIVDWVNQGAPKDPPTTAPTLGSTMSMVPMTIVAATSTFNINLINTGTADATSCALSITGTSASEYSMSSSCSTIPIAGSGCPVAITFSPLAAGIRQATLNVSCSAPSGGPWTITQVINAQGGNAPAITVSPNPHDYGNVNLGSSSTKIFAVNITGLPTGGVAFSCSPVLTQTGTTFSSTGNDCNFSGTNATETCHVTVVAKPMSTSPFTGTLNVSCSTVFAYSSNISLNVAGAGCTQDGQYMDPVTSTCHCPDGYELATVGAVVNICRPKNPTYSGSKIKTDFFRPTDLASVADYNGFPACGPTRIAIGTNNIPLDISSGNVPNSSSHVNSLRGDPGVIIGYRYAVGYGPLPQLPQYLYGKGFRCACAYQIYGGSLTTEPLPPPGTGVASTVVPAIPADHYIGIKNVTSATQQSTSPLKYSPVAIALESTGTTDGRLGSEWSSGINAQCGCPNLNEVKAPTYSANTALPQGAYCRSIFADSTGKINDSHVVLVAFNPSLHDVTGSSQVQNRSSEPKDPITGSIIAKIALPTSVGGANTQTYQRRIWTCASGYNIDTSTVPAKCTEPNAVLTKHKCDEGSGGGLASAVSSSISGGGTSLATQFKNAVNKKLSCCTHDYTKGYQNSKFDCIDNSKNVYNDFDALWTSADSSADGGQLNAIALSNASGKLITGFYSLSGLRCDQYSEFGANLHSARVDPKALATPAPQLGVWSVDPPVPPSGPTLNKVVTASGLGVPSTAAERLACPILVRAAITAECSKTNPALPAMQTYYKNGSQDRCTVADKIKVFIQVKQVTEIEGKKTMKTFDAFMNQPSAIQFDVGKIVSGSNGMQCPDGSTRIGSQCVYQ